MLTMLRRRFARKFPRGSTCWCTWDESNAFPHWRWVREADYPDHEPSVQWNIPEPLPGE